MAGRINDKFWKGLFFRVELQDGNELILGIRRAHDGFDDLTVSLRIAKEAVLNGVGRMSKLSPFSLQVAFEEVSDAKSFTFART